MQARTSPLVAIREAARQLSVTPRTLKYYEELGLVIPARSDGRYRLYSAADLDKLGRILRLRSLGFSLHGITEMLKQPLAIEAGGRRQYSAESLHEISSGLAEQITRLNARIVQVRRELKDAETLRNELNDDLDYLRRRLAGTPSDALEGERLAARERRSASRDSVNGES
ncbi:MerR family transcriptional regulator [Burkholderia arboris]|uniref:MerR family transcriptional regulator n=1 Tax=Burkholderia arboris TaxID=488730 RepID=UPI00210902A2|nr:MerR family transcriptional regulator [Burkholderia arboris]UTV59878.1 MerR family transcriptional regulator [Burkholderia arboris]